jgi:hypothetical protein
MSPDTAAAAAAAARPMASPTPTTDDTSERFRAAIARFDAANAEDPARSRVNGRDEPAALVTARRMSAWLDRLVPGAPEPLRLAVRCHHLRRWAYPRDAYPMTRAGYHQWRTAAARGHAEQAGEILRAVGYDEATIARVGALVRKEGLKAGDRDTQGLEDAACLAFLESGFAEFAARHEEPKVVAILQRTWRKMSPAARSAASELPLAGEVRGLVERALAGTREGEGNA